MMLPRTYRSRLVTYSILLVSFLTGTLVYSYHYTRDFVLKESSEHLNNAVQTHNTQLQKDIANLIRTSKLIGNDLRLQEYVNLANLNGDTGPLKRLLRQTFAWLPNNHNAVLSNTGKILLGQDHPQLTTAVINNNPWQNQNMTFYIQHGEGDLELVAVEPIHYRDKIIGILALTHPISTNWVEWHQEYDGGDVFLVKDNKVTFSTSERFVGSNFKEGINHVTLNNETYRIFHTALPNATENLPDLWYGISETRLLNTLVAQGERIFMMVAIGAIAILLVGLAIIRSLNKPLSSLIDLTHKVTRGELPSVKRTKIHTEIDLLTNHFVDMIQALKEKQAQIDEAHKELHQSAVTDTLTGLYNRRHLRDLFPKLQAQASRDRRVLTAILCDLDYFKQINDKFGHLAGDMALIEFTNILKSQSRGNDFLYRMGGEEFLVLSVSDDSSGSKILAEKIRTTTREQAIVYQGQTITITVSCGISYTWPSDKPDSSLNSLLSRADKALYQAKQHGRNQVRVYEDEDKKDNKAKSPLSGMDEKIKSLL